MTYLGTVKKGRFKGYRAYSFGDRIQLSEPESESVGYGNHQRPPNQFITGHEGSSSYEKVKRAVDRMEHQS